MMITIRTGKDRKDYRSLKERVTELEAEVRDLRTSLDGHGHGDYLTDDDLPNIELIGDLAEDVDRRLRSIDCWKADRHHSHPPAKREGTGWPASA
jgi:hypothetical protein